MESVKIWGVWLDQSKRCDPWTHGVRPRVLPNHLRPSWGHSYRLAAASKAPARGSLICAGRCPHASRRAAQGACRRSVNARRCSCLCAGSGSHAWAQP